MARVGRYTASLLLITVGILLLLDQTSQTRYLALLKDWWPVALIVFGCEYIVVHAIYRKSERHLRLDVGGLFLSLLIACVVVVGTTQTAMIPANWLKYIQFNIDLSNFSYAAESGNKFEKAPIKVPLAAGTNKIFFENPNGSIQLRSGAVTDIEVAMTVWVDRIEKDQAEQIAEQSVLEYTEGNTLRITAKGQEYSGNFSAKRKPRMNLVVTVPADRRADYELQLKNGKVEASQIVLRRDMRIRTTNGAITVAEIDGDLSASTTNGAIEASKIRGKATLSTTNGTVAARTIGGDAKVDTTNGAVTVEQAGGAIDADTTNGRITIGEAFGSVKADTTNGMVSVTSHTVGGDWEIKTVNGSIEARLPLNADAEIKGSTSNGTVSSNLPLLVEKKKLSGKLGAGKHSIKLDTNNSIDVNKLD